MIRKMLIPSQPVVRPSDALCTIFASMSDEEMLVWTEGTLARMGLGHRQTVDSKMLPEVFLKMIFRMATSLNEEGF